MVELGWRSGEIARWTSGRLIGSAEVAISRVAIDSREVGAQTLFVALPGERVDGHDFAASAVAAGASAVLVTRELTAIPVPQIVVTDGVAALQALGRVRRALFTGPVIGITGSAGKTTTRRLAAAVLATRYRTHEPRKNHNNHLGVPLTLLELEPEHEALVLELGCSDFGEIALLAGIGAPEVGLVTMVGAAHLEKLGDLDGVARAKGELFLGLPADGVSVVNLDDPRVAAMPRHTSRAVGYGASPDADVRLLARRAGDRGQRLEISFGGEPLVTEIPLAGAHNAGNAVAAAAIGLAVGLDATEVARGLAAVRPPPGRMELGPGPNGTLIIDDTYNANPSSMRAALAALAELRGTHGAVAVLGDMLELGAASEAAHLEIGRAVFASGIDRLITLGQLGTIIGRGAAEAGLPWRNIHRVTTPEAAASRTREQLAPGDVVLIKGSRGMQMERVVQRLREEG